MTEEDLFKLHRLTVSDDHGDIYRPIGAWKREDNGTYGDEDGKSVYMAYASADETPLLMKIWLADFRQLLDSCASQDQALSAYVRAHVSFVRIHPFFDGNGRLARLLGNLPVLLAGCPPIVIPAESRLDYIGCLWKYQRKVGPISVSHPDLLPQKEELSAFTDLVRKSWQTTLDLVSAARERH